jgi:hypothetical protein
MTREEEVVRATYAKLAYSARLGVYMRYALDTESTSANAIRLPQLQTELDKQLSFKFQNIRVGELSDIGSLYWEDLVTKPDHDLVSVAYNLQRMAGQETTPPTSMYFVLAGWGASTDYEANWHIPVSKVIREMLPKDTGMLDVVWSRYAAYTVSVAVGVGQRTYKALFLFGKRPDGSEVVWRTDHVLGMGSLDMLFDRSLYPEPLIETSLRELPAISAWIAKVGVAFGSDQRDIVCNGVTGKCGIPIQALKKSLRVPIDPKVKAFHEAFRREAEKLVAAGKLITEDLIASCSDANYDFTLNPTAFGSFDHASPSSVTSNSHSVKQPFAAICQYSSNGTQYCNTTCDIGASGTGTHTDQGKTVTGSVTWWP